MLISVWPSGQISSRAWLRRQSRTPRSGRAIRYRVRACRRFIRARAKRCFAARRGVAHAAQLLCASGLERCIAAKQRLSLRVGPQITPRGVASLDRGTPRRGDSRLAGHNLRSPTRARMKRRQALGRPGARRNASLARVTGIDVIFHGHTPLAAPLAVANRRWLDTGVFMADGALTLAELLPDGRLWSIDRSGQVCETAWTAG